MELIETPRLLLRKTTPDIYKEVWEHYNEEDIRKYFGISSDEGYQVAREKYIGGRETFRTSFVFFHLIDKSNGTIIGDCDFHTWYVLHSRAEIGYSIYNDSDKNKGFMKEAIVPVLDHGFEQMKLERIEAFISPQNIPSQRLVRSMGFIEEGRMRSHFRHNGKLDDSLIFGLLKQDYQPTGK